MIISVVILIPPLFSFQAILSPLLSPTDTWKNQTEDANKNKNNNHHNHHHLVTQHSDSSITPQNKTAADETITTTTPTTRKNRTKSIIVLTEGSSFVSMTRMDTNQATTAQVAAVARVEETAVILPPVHGSAIFETCQAQLVGRVSRIQQQRYMQNQVHGQPILQSMVPVDGTYRILSTCMTHGHRRPSPETTIPIGLLLSGPVMEHQHFYIPIKLRMLQARVEPLC
jgi:hypothetical protein